MKKSALALAVGAAFAAPATAQTTVQIYGKMYPQLGWYKSSGATEVGGVTGNIAPQVTNAATVNNDKSRASVDVANSYLGFRGEEKLGGSLSAIYQLEQSVEFDTGTGVFATRNSFLGLRSGFGTIKLGNMDTIYKEFGDQFSMFGISSGNFVSHSNTLSSNGVGTSRLARFHERAPNSVQYLSPEFSDFQFGIQYSPDEIKGNPTPATRSNLDAQWWSYGIKYEADRLYVSVHQEYRKDFFGGSATASGASVTNIVQPISNNVPVPLTGSEHSKDTATRLSGAFKITPNHRITGDIARLEYKESGQAAAGRFEKLEKTNWAVGWEARWGGPWRTGVSYVKVNEGNCSLSSSVACSTSGTDGNQVNLGAAYDFSKRTFIYAIYAKLTAGESAQFDNWSNGTPARGADNTQFAIGMSTSF